MEWNLEKTARNFLDNFDLVTVPRTDCFKNHMHSKFDEKHLFIIRENSDLSYMPMEKTYFFIIILKNYSILRAYWFLL